MAQGLLAPAPQAAAPQAEPVAAPVAAPAQQGAPKYRSRVIEAIPQPLREKFEKIVLAGMAALYSKDMQPVIERELAGDKPIWQKIGEGVAKLLATLDQQSKKTMPQELLIPAGIELVAEVASFLKESGREQVSDDDMQKATLYVAVVLGKMYGATDEQLKSLATGGKVAPQAEPEAAAEPAPAPAPQAAPTQQPMIGA